jgi:hypothetical protein
MKNYHIYFYGLKLLVLTLIALMSLKIITVKTKIFILIDTLFKLSLGIFIIIFFLKNNSIKINEDDRILIILSGFILILLIDYIEVINILFNKNIQDPRCNIQS